MLPQPEDRRFLLYLVLSMATAVTISATAYLCAWITYGGGYLFQGQQLFTRIDLEEVRKDIEHYRERKGELPANLEDLKAEKKNADDWIPSEDGWGRPFHYQVEGDRYELYSLGQDDQPGGVGLDADLYAGKVDSWNEFPTLWQFTTMPETRSIQLICLLAGILAFPLCLLGFKRGATNRTSLERVLMRHALTAIFAVLAALMISVFFVSGH
jgi:Type II secretion system (T2SS), protein G